MKTSQKTSFERHAQTIMVAIMTALVFWVGNSVNDQSKKLIQVEERMIGMGKQLEYLQAFANQPRFTKDDFHSEMKIYDARIGFIENELKSRINFMNNTNSELNDIGKRVQKIENDMVRK